MKPVVALFLFLFFTSFVYGQDFLSWKLNDRYFTVQAGFGFASYRGELKHNYSVQNEISNENLAVEARLLPKIGIRAEFARYNIRGADKHAADSSYARQRNLSFTSVNYEMTIQGVFYLKKYRGIYHKRWKLDPYLLLGIGGTFISPETTMDGKTYKLYKYHTENINYSRFTMIIPVGMGLKWRITPFLNFITEIDYRYTFSDYLDDVSGNYPTQYKNQTQALLSNRKDEVGIINQSAYEDLSAGKPRGDAATKDRYLFLMLKFEYFLPPLRKK